MGAIHGHVICVREGRGLRLRRPCSRLKTLERSAHFRNKGGQTKRTETEAPTHRRPVINGSKTNAFF